MCHVRESHNDTFTHVLSSAAEVCRVNATRPAIICRPTYPLRDDASMSFTHWVLWREEHCRDRMERRMLAAMWLTRAVPLLFLRVLGEKSSNPSISWLFTGCPSRI